MNLLIDATAVTKHKAGVGVYAKNLIHELTALHADLHLFLLAQDDDPDMDYGALPNVTMLWVPSGLFRKLPLRFLLEQVGIPFLLLKHRIDVVHSLHYSFPLVRPRGRQVVTFHDTTFIDMPEVHEKIKVLYFGFFMNAAVRMADSVIFVSYSAQRDCNARLGPPRGLSTVIHHGKSEAFRPDLDPELLRRIKQKYGLRQDFILFIGTIEPRKNLPQLVTAFQSLAKAHPNLVLVIAGKKGWMYDSLFETIRRLKMESRVIFTGFLPEEDKPFLLSAATVFVYPSLYEGFGIPVLEALACGVPTVTSNTSSLPEVAGKAAIMIDPQNAAEIADALERLLSDSDLRSRLIEEAAHQAAKFNWKKTASETLNAYTSIVGARRVR